MVYYILDTFLLKPTFHENLFSSTQEIVCYIDLVNRFLVRATFPLFSGLKTELLNTLVLCKASSEYPDLRQYSIFGSTSV